MPPVTRLTVHHEGAGVPSDVVRADPYSYWIGVTTWSRIQSPAESTATLNYNGRSLDVCLSGNREVVPVTDADIELIRQAIADCRNRDEVVDMPDVVPHYQSPGSSTACPGVMTMAVWSKIVTACRAPQLAPKPKPDDEEVEMFIAATEGRPTWLVGAGKNVKLENVQPYVDAGLKVIRVTAAENDRLKANS